MVSPPAADRRARRADRIVETWIHESLVADDGLYARLYALNFSSFDDVPDALVREALSATGRT